MGKRENNLIPQNKRPPEERKRIARMGAEATNKKRRIQRTFREAMEKLLDKEHKQTGEDGRTHKIDGRDALMSVLMKEAMKGNTKAIEMVLSISGEGLATKVEVTGKDGTELFKNMSDKELNEKIKEIQNKLK